jgi:hypothetical protein
MKFNIKLFGILGVIGVIEVIFSHSARGSGFLDIGALLIYLLVFLGIPLYWRVVNANHTGRLMVIDFFSIVVLNVFLSILSFLWYLTNPRYVFDWGDLGLGTILILTIFGYCIGIITAMTRKAYFS